MSAPAPAFYAVGRSGWRAWVTILHLPYTAWHLAYVVVGGCLAGEVVWGRLGVTVLAFALAMGVGAHALDELNGRPLGTTIPSSALVGAAVLSVAVACGLGVVVADRTTWWLVLPIVAGALLVPAYNLEWLGGRVHTDLGFALSWGAFPVLTAFLAQTGEIRPVALVAAAWATVLSLAQRALSTSVRRLRRDVVAVDGVISLREGGQEHLDRGALIAAPESALRLLALATVLVAATLVVGQLT